jgi:FAD/FMN-containing dehydrogenase/Fe-S oxidoreductase
MIPRLPTRPQQLLQPPGLFERLIESGFCGEIETGEATRTVFSTDNSIYQLKPTGVVFPRDAADIKVLTTVLGEPEFSGIPIAPRGGGTGTNGQSLTSGIVVDCSRHMNRILKIDPVRRVARVEAGVVKDQLNRALKPYGLFFAPELSTSNRATIGGMISTDACGQGSCLYGKTSNHVLGLRIVLTDGTDWWSRPLDRKALEAVKVRPDRVGEIYRTAERIARAKRDDIAAVFPKLNRYMTGYDLAHVIREDETFDLNAILCGSEGTLAIVAEAELNLLPLPKHAALINIRYGDFNAALEDARALVALRVASVETVDEKVLSLAKGDIGWAGIARFFPDDAMGEANGINIVEVLADDPGELASKVAAVTSLLDTGERGSRHGYTTTSDKADIEVIWSMRKRAVGLLGNVEGPVRPVPFVEDTAVPPENLAVYIREFRAILDGAGLSYGMFGHVDAGVLHVRPALDLTRENHVRLVRDITDAVVALTRKHGGVLWGEHGKGVRSEYVPEFFGPLYPSLQEIKRAFDPGNQMNPGKIAAPAGASLLKIDEVPMRGQIDRTIAQDIRAGFDNVTFCNGNGACFDFDETSPMCPSFKATGDRRYSPKGRASLMREWLRQLAERSFDPREAAKRLRRANPATSLVRRALNSVDPRNRDDFSHEVRAAMDTCLACKACTGECPVKVSVPAFRAKFLELYYGRYLRPLKDPLVGSIEPLLPLLARTRRVYNLLATSQIGHTLMRIVGLTALPRLPEVGLAEEARRFSAGIATLDRMERLSAGARARVVVFVPDAFTASFDPKAVASGLELALKMGFIPYLAVPLTNGKALHVHGYLGRFERAATRSARYLNGLAELGIALVGIDPSMTLAYRSEYRDALGGGLKAKVLLPQEWLCENLDRLIVKAGVADGRIFRLLAHCTERTNAPAAAKQWASAFEQLGIRLATAGVGCCGMAGTFGHEARNRHISEKLYELGWRPVVEKAAGNEVLMATGYSCRSQIKKLDAKEVPHPLQVINGLVA